MTAPAADTSRNYCFEYNKRVRVEVVVGLLQLFPENALSNVP